MQGNRGFGADTVYSGPKPFFVIFSLTSRIFSTIYPMRTTLLTVFAALLLLPAMAQPVTPQDRRRAAELMRRMTLDEKVGQLVQQRGKGAVTGPDKTQLSVEQLVREGRCGSVFNIYSFEETERLQKIAVEESRLGIPLLIGADVIHGFRTIFPVNLAVAASWDPSAAESLARVAAREASAMGIQWTFSPMCDVSRDPRWGRVSEGAGEDPYLGSRVAEAMVRGYQGDLSDPSSILACVKHFAAYGAPQAGREYHTVDMSERVFRDSYLPPYRAALDAGAVTVMTSFNDLDGVPATANRWLLRDLLRDELGFGGFVVTDYGTIGELKAHGVAADDAQAAELALRAGVNMDMMSAAYLFHAAELVRQGRIAESLIDSLCCEVLAVKFRLGLFDDPFRYQVKEREECYYAPEHLDAARRVARSSMVLLENRGDVLPLKKGSRIALVGPFADARRDMIGSWVHFSEWRRTSTFLEGLRARFGGDKVFYARGCDPRKAIEGGIAEAVAAAGKADVVLVALGLSEGESGEAASLASIALPEVQRQLLESLKQTGKPIVVLLVTGRPMELAREAELADALLLTWYPGTMAGEALADVVSGDYNPSGRLPMTFPRTVGQVPIHYDMKNTGRPAAVSGQPQKYTSRYIDVPNSPQYCFGYGLGYTTFGYSDLRVLTPAAKLGDEVRVAVRVTNTGGRDGEEVVQLYVRDLIASVTRPVRELKGFEKVMLRAGESREVTFTLTPDDLSFWRLDNKWGQEPGDYHVWAGHDSDCTLGGSFRITE